MILTHSESQALHKPVLSPDGKLIAVISADEQLHVINLAEAIQGHRSFTTLNLPRTTRAILKECHIVRWAPETIIAPSSPDIEDEDEDVAVQTSSNIDSAERTWLLLSNGSRVITLNTQLPYSSTDTNTNTSRSAITNTRPGTRTATNLTTILADYEIGTQYGKLNLVEFAFNHRHALVTFEYGTTATILSLTKPHRDEIAHVKFPDSRGFAASPDSRYLAMLRRDKSQDRITVFELDVNNNNKLTYKSFDVHTVDAQSVTWCPAAEKPIVAVCESAAYGTKVCFFTAQGHALRQLDVSSSVFNNGFGFDIGNPLPLEIEGVGVTFWKWLNCAGANLSLTVQAVADGQKRVVVRYVDMSSLAARGLGVLTHPELIDGSETFVWQERAGGGAAGGGGGGGGSSTAAAGAGSDGASTTFTRHTGVFEATHPQSQPHQDTTTQPRTTQSPKDDQVDLFTINSDQTLAATRLRCTPRTLFLWRLDANQQPPNLHPHPHPHPHTRQQRPHPQPQPHTVLLFTHPIRQALFHPWLPNVLVILTAGVHSKPAPQPQPRLYAWHDEHLAPTTFFAGLGTKKPTTSITATTNFSATWLPQCLDGEEEDYTSTNNNNNSNNKNKNNKRCPFLIASSAAFKVGTLACLDEGIVFEPSSSLDRSDNHNHNHSHQNTGLNTPDLDGSSSLSYDNNNDNGTNNSNSNGEDTTDMPIDTPSRPRPRPSRVRV